MHVWSNQLITQSDKTFKPADNQTNSSQKQVYKSLAGGISVTEAANIVHMQLQWGVA